MLKTRRTGHDEVNSKRSPEEEDGEEESGGSGSWCGDGEDGDKKPLLPPPKAMSLANWMCLRSKWELMLLWMLL